MDSGVTRLKSPSHGSAGGESRFEHVGACPALARQAGAQVVVVDVGVASLLEPRPGLVLRKVAAGTGDLATGPAMTVAQATLPYALPLGLHGAFVPA